MAEDMKFEIADPEWAANLQTDLEQYMMGLYDSIDAEPDTPEADPFTESGIPFCGCNVCEGREILSFLTPRIIKGYKENKVLLVEESDY
jgi:hypothetical protein